MKRTQIEKIENILWNSGRRSPGISTKTLAARAKVPAETVSKRVFDLRNQGLPIYTNQRAGKTFYRLAA